MFISMNYENSCEYLCFCCVDAVDCGAASPRCMGGNGGRLSPLPLWIADQARNDVTCRGQ